MNQDKPIPNLSRSYDDVAGTYERINVPRLFEAPARMLVEFAAPPQGARVLDVGAGTGAVARAVKRFLGGIGTVVAVDPSLAMLEAAQRGGADPVVAGILPQLPFARHSFNLVLSAFVITHTDDPEAAARDMRRVLCPGGKIALSAWGAGADACLEAWMDVAREFVAEETLSAAIAHVLPGEARFAKPRALDALLAATDFENVRESTTALEFSMRVGEYLDSREVGAGGRALRFLLDDSAWVRLRARLREVISSRFQSGISYTRDVHFAVARRPDH